MAIKVSLSKVVEPTVARHKANQQTCVAAVRQNDDLLSLPETANGPYHRI